MADIDQIGGSLFDLFSQMIHLVHSLHHPVMQHGKPGRSVEFGALFAVHIQRCEYYHFQATALEGVCSATSGCVLYQKLAARTGGHSSTEWIRPRRHVRFSIGARGCEVQITRETFSTRVPVSGGRFRTSWRRPGLEPYLPVCGCTWPGLITGMSLPVGGGVLAFWSPVGGGFSTPPQSVSCFDS